MQPIDAAASLSGLSVAAIFAAIPPVIILQDIGDGPFISRWNVEGVPTPSAEQWSEALAALDAPTTKAELLAYAAAKRWQVETGGIVVNGSRVNTSRESQNMISNADRYVQSALVASVRFKPNGVFVTLDAATLHTIALAVGAHVQAAFDNEDALQIAIEAGTITTIAQIDAYAWTE